jgi:hypothetical protein
MSDVPERVLLYERLPAHAPADEAPLEWSIEVGSLVDAEEVLGTICLWIGLDVDVSSPWTGFVTYLAPEARDGEPLLRIAPLAADDPRSLARARIRRDLREAHDRAQRIRGRSAAAGRRVVSTRIVMAPIIARCAGESDPVLSESLLLVRATVDAAAACAEPITGTILFCDTGGAATRWLRFRVEERSITYVADTAPIEQCVMCRIRAPGPDRVRWSPIDRAFPLAIGAEDDSPERSSRLYSPYAAEIAARLGG